jgi:hypothetical protein
MNPAVQAPDIYRQLHPLTDEARIEAKQRAARVVQLDLGNAPDRAHFQHITASKYPAWVNRLILALCVFVLIAAFIPSAIRLFFIGSATFAQAIDDTTSATAAGIAIVIMAETAQVLFSLAAAVLNTTSHTARRLLFASMGAATVLALVGNAQVSLPGHWQNPFAYLEALLPPLLVLSTAYVLKEQMLSSIEQRHANERAYQEALDGWQASSARPEAHPRYTSALANALRDALKELNGRGAGATARRELMQTLTVEDWRALVRREMQAEEWYAAPEAVQLPAQAMEIPVSLTAPRPIMSASEGLAAAAPIPLFSNGNGKH